MASYIFVTDFFIPYILIFTKKKHQYYILMYCIMYF